MAVLVLLEGKARPEMVAALKAALPKLFPATRAYKGCRGITAHLNDDGQTVVFVEHWETKADYEHYLSWRTETGVIAGLVDMLESPPTIRYFDMIAA